MRRRDDDAVTPLIGLLIGITIFLVTFYYVIDSAYQQGPRESIQAQANYNSLANNLATTLLAPGSGWYTGNEADICLDQRENPDKLTPDDVPQGQFGLASENCDPRDLISSNILSYPKIASMYEGQFGSASNDRLDYEEARRSLGLDERNLQFHVRSWPVLRSDQEMLASGRGDPNLRVAYVGDYLKNEGGVPLERLVAHTAGVDDAADYATAWVEIENDGTTSTIFEIQYELRLAQGNIFLTRHTPLMAPDDIYRADLRLEKTSDWRWANEGSHPGSIRICTILLEPDGDIVDGSLLPPASMTIYTAPDPPGYTSVAAFPETTFTTPNLLNANLLSGGANDPGDDAHCVLHNNLPLGGYFYGMESVVGTGWGDPEYNDQNTGAALTTNDFFPYSGELFTADPGDDAGRNTNSDGHLILTAARPMRTIILLNQHVGGAGGYTGPDPPIVVHPREVAYTINDVEGPVGDGRIDFTDVTMTDDVERDLHFVHADKLWWDYGGGPDVDVRVQYQTFEGDGSFVPPITLVAANGATNSGGATTLVISKPAGTVSQDVLLAQITVRGGSGTSITPPSGWTLASPQGRVNSGTTLAQAIYWKVATPTEPATYSFGFSSSQRATGGIATYRGVDTASPLHKVAGQANSASTSVAAPGVTPTITNTMLVGFFGSQSQTTSFAPAAGMTERWDVSNTGSGRTAAEAADEVWPNAQSTGTRTATSSHSGVSIGHLVALRPQVGYTDRSLQLYDPTPSPIGGVIELGPAVSGSQDYSIDTPEQAYEIHIHKDLLPLQVWNIDKVNVHEGPILPYTPALFPGSYTPEASTLLESAFLDVLVEDFLPNAASADWTDAQLPYAEGGDVYPDVKDAMNDVLGPLLLDENGPGSADDVGTLDAYSVLVVGSNVEHEAMTSNAIKDAIDKWVRAGGTLIVFGSAEQEVNWLQPLFHAGLESASDGLYTPDEQNPVLNVPNDLDYVTYSRVSTWSFGPQDVSKFTHVIKDSAEDGAPDRLALSDAGSYGRGRIVLTGYEPFDLRPGTSTDCAVPMDADTDCEALRFVQNLLTQGYRELFIDFGPGILPGVDNGVSHRIATVNHPDMGVAVEIRVLVYVFPG